MNEYIVWGIPQGGYTEEILVGKINNKPITSAEKAILYARFCIDQMNCTNVRIQIIDFKTQLTLDFINSINL